MQTTIHAYNFDTREADQREAYEALRMKLQGAGLKCFETWGGEGHYSFVRDIDGQTITLETSCLFDNQWNTAPIAGKSDKGLRVFDWAQDYPINFSKSIKRGHYLEQTPAMAEARRNTVKCGYCGKQEPAAKGYVFCPHCLDSAYLKESDLPLTRMLPVDAGGFPDRAPLTEAEAAHLLPLYRDAQLHGSTERGKARKAKAFKDVHAKYHRITEAALAERDGFLWLLGKGFSVDNVIFYSHTGRFCFGWREPLDAGVKSDLLNVLSEFPFDYDLKG
jgi:hypothetical protein